MARNHADDPRRSPAPGRDDAQTGVNALSELRVPDDAGDLRGALKRLLGRIPDGWGRWISCDSGWYPLLVELDGQMSALLPSYVIHQVKEKYGGLRYYWEPGEEVDDPGDSEPPMPAKDAGEAEWEGWRTQHEAWCERRDAYLETQEGARRIADLRRRIDLANELVDAAERRAAATCERCGTVGSLHHTPGVAPWCKTLCSGCADREGYLPWIER